ncbi:MAG TPA: Rossmann-like and DUF2520 domain-containing protein [Pyrinomonadaceae bacterium]|nr:Rossmann-like and DUF2520 domain-containing protein [Pyrinomonadaceae bacterium]
MTKKFKAKQKPSVAVIGAGRLGQALAIALQSCEYSIVALVARHRRKAEQAATVLGKNGSRPRALAASQLAELPASDLILIATPDDAIAQTAQRLSKSLDSKNRTTVLHTSGALSSEALNSLRAVGFETGSIHPLVSISEPTAGAEALRGAFYCLEGTRKAKAIAASLVRDLGGNSFTIKPENKALYHAAAVMASPHLVSLFDLATEMLAACGLSRRKSQQVLAPLLESTVNNLKTSNTERALTGTFARGDVATVRRHLEALAGKELAEALAVYKLLGLHSLKLAEKNELDSRLSKQIRKIVKSEK